MKQLVVEEAKNDATTRYHDCLVAICGAGSLGGNLASALARRGFQRLRIIDRDWVEEQNLATQPFQPRDIGTPKARSLARTLYDEVQAEAEPLVVELTEENASQLLAGSHLVIDAFDSSADRRIVAECCGKLQLPCLHLAIDVDPRYGVLSWHQDESLLDGSGYEDCAPSKMLADQLVDAGCESIVHFLLTGEKHAGRVGV